MINALVFAVGVGVGVIAANEERAKAAASVSSERVVRYVRAFTLQASRQAPNHAAGWCEFCPVTGDQPCCVCGSSPE